jgi:hypothetical protein
LGFHHRFECAFVFESADEAAKALVDLFIADGKRRGRDIDLEAEQFVVDQFIKRGFASDFEFSGSDEICGFPFKPELFIQGALELASSDGVAGHTGDGVRVSLPVTRNGSMERSVKNEKIPDEVGENTPIDYEAESGFTEVGHMRRERKLTWFGIV